MQETRNIDFLKDQNRLQPGSPVLTWNEALAIEREQEYFRSILRSIESERRSGETIYPSNFDMFACFKLTEFARVKVVILGQDPYHGPGQAHGLSFSVPPGRPLPPSLRNIFQELREDLGLQPPGGGCLEKWASEGVFLLNAFLSVRQGKPGSHASLGWEQFTDTVIRVLSERRENLVFLLWGAFAGRKAALIDGKRHCIIQTAHPSPLSAHRGFFGSRPFSKANAYLASHGLQPVNWEL